jgi:hypothetical protein
MRLGWAPCEAECMKVSTADSGFWVLIIRFHLSSLEVLQGSCPTTYQSGDLLDKFTSFRHPSRKFLPRWHKVLAAI